ncbi:MAG TPA: protein kinase, partial [bacterium]
MPAFDIKKNKDLLMMIMALGDAYLERGLHGEAAKRYHQLLDLKVANRHLYTNLSKAYLGLKRFDQRAIEIYQRAIQYDPSNKEIYTALATIFINENREDASAVEIYEIALKHETPIFANVAERLAEIYFKHKDFVKCREASAKLLNRVGYHPKVLNLFLQSCWVAAFFNDAINLLKKLVDTAENNTTLLKNLCITYLEKIFHSEQGNQAVRFSYIDRQLVTDYLSKSAGFEDLQELCFFLELKKFLLEKDYWNFRAPTESEEEAELAYSEVAAAETPAKARTEASGKNVNAVQQIFNKLNPFEPLAVRAAGVHSTLTYEDFKKEGAAAVFATPAGESAALKVPDGAEVVTVMELTNYQFLQQNFGTDQVQQMRNKLFVVLTDVLERNKVFHIWLTANGLIFFSKEVLDAVGIAVEVLNKLNRHNFVSEPNEQIRLSVGIHHARQDFTSDEEQGMKDLCVGLKVGIVGDDDLSEDDRPMYGRIFQKTDRIFLSSKAYREVKSSNRFKVNTIGQFKLKYLKDTLSLSEVGWRNPIDDLKFGFIKKLGRFDLLVEVGSKGAVKVFKGKDSVLQRFIVLKVIQSEAFNALPPNNQQKMQFYQIAKSFGQMNHPNITNIYEVDEDQGLTYVAREFVEGIPVTDAFKNGKGYSPERLVKIMYQICKGLQFSHRLGFCHLNLKPNNVRLGPNDEVKIMDFYIPKSLFFEFDNFKEDPEQLLYVAPERINAGAGQIRSGAGDSRSDIFSLGVLLYHLVTQLYPFASRNIDDLAHAILNKMPPPPSGINKQLPPFCESFIMKCLAKEPDKRFQSVEQMVTLLKKTFEGNL